MAKLNIAGVVQYADLSPVHGAVVKIIDLDEGGNGNDIILEDVTDAGGKFKKQSKEWIDLNNVKIRWLCSSELRKMMKYMKVRFCMSAMMF